MDFNSILGIIISTILGFIISYYFYSKSNKKIKLYCKSSSSVLIPEEFKNYHKLQVFYNNKQIKQLQYTTIVIENIGDITIEKSDLIPDSYIKISTPGLFFLQDENDFSLYDSNERISSSLSKINDNELRLTFDLLKPQDMISISIFHNYSLYVEMDLKNGSICEKTSTNYTPELIFLNSIGVLTFDQFRKKRRKIIIRKFFIFLLLGETISIIILSITR